MKHLLKLLADNRGRGEFRAEQTGDEATLYLYDTIVSDDYFGGVSAIGFAKALAAITAPVIHLRINSPGGDVFAARAMEQAIREHGSKVIAHIDGYAASAASYVALAADEVVIAAGGFYMIHKAWTMAWGNADDLLSTAALLEKIDDALIATYAKETGQSVDQITEWLKAETWFNAEEAVANGFADRVAEDAPAAQGAWNLSAYAKAPGSVENVCTPPARAELSPDLSARQAALYTAAEAIVEDLGPFDQTALADGAHYMGAEANPFKAEGLRCAHCNFYQGPRACEIVAGDIDPDALCKLWVIPARLVAAPAATADPAPAADASRQRAELRMKHYDRIEA